ncbi:hypothetical protein [Streptomyces longisporoflavus]|uniref:Uncharacterized protein n=1 Tax=Streptomyces longisporoflavus TaxID=28044 RepID=A0ABW7QWE2_9ACTN
MNVPGGHGFVLPSRAQRKVLIERLEALRATGWAERDTDADADFTADERAELLAALLETLRSA